MFCLVWITRPRRSYYSHLLVPFTVTCDDECDKEGNRGKQGWEPCITGVWHEHTHTQIESTHIQRELTHRQASSCWTPSILRSQLTQTRLQLHLKNTNCRNLLLMLTLQLLRGQMNGGPPYSAVVRDFSGNMSYIMENKDLKKTFEQLWGTV